MDFLKLFDGSGRKPREIQRQGLEWLSENWHKSDRFCINAPVGTGKSAMAKAIAKITDAHIITPSNLLIDQYIADYKSHNYLKGKSHYQCKWGVSCQDWQAMAPKEDRCIECPYTEARDRACAGESTFFNPMSLYYTARNFEDTPSVVIVDEAHQLSSMLLLLAGARLRKGQYKWTPNVVNELNLIPWLERQILRYTALVKFHKNNADELKVAIDELEHLKLTRAGMTEDAQNYAIYIEKGTYRGRPDEFLCIKPLKPPRFIVNTILNAKKVIMMSGTLAETDIRDLFGDRSYKFLDMPSPIPKENRVIKFEPVSFKMNFAADPAQVVRAIEEVIFKNPGLNTIIHVSYNTSERLAPHFSIPILVNDPNNKDEMLTKFKTEGGIFLAAGCAEGIDLKDDLCRLNIIPQLSFPNLQDAVVQKRKALADGSQWYALETLKTTIQQAGRSTRGTEDYSTTIILDPNFSWVYKSVKNKLPASFKEAIQWGK